LLPEGARRTIEEGLTMAGSTKSTETPASPGRRGFFKAAATGAAGAALAAPVLLVGGEAVAQQSAEEKKRQRYRETDHVRTYYETNRY
jgi:hypothetical protein